MASRTAIGSRTTTAKPSPRVDRKSVLSTAWIFVLLNVLFRDIHELFRAGMLEQMLSGTVNGVTVTDQDLLLAGVGLQIPLAMVLLPRLLPNRISRWANAAGAVVTIAAFLIPTLVTSTPDPDNLLFAAVEFVGLLFIIVYAWTWRPTATE
jgi:hypothetical protein